MIELLSVKNLETEQTIWFINKGKGFRRVSRSSMEFEALMHPVKSCFRTELSKTHLRGYCSAQKEKN